MNALLGEKLAITSPKAQTTRNKILGILNEPNYQIIFSDTPGILSSSYKLHDKMLKEIELVKQGTDVFLYLMDINDNLQENLDILKGLNSRVPILVVLNKIDKHKKNQLDQIEAEFKKFKMVHAVLTISAKEKTKLPDLLETLIGMLPEMPAYYADDTMTDKPMRFFVAEIVREKIFDLLDEELPYHSAVLVRQFEEKNTLTKIVADIVVSRETQKAIIIGSGGSMIKKIGQLARADIEKFIDRKVFLELHVKVRKDWRNNELYLKEYGY